MDRAERPLLPRPFRPGEGDERRLRRTGGRGECHSSQGQGLRPGAGVKQTPELRPSGGRTESDGAMEGAGGHGPPRARSEPSGALVTRS